MAKFTGKKKAHLSLADKPDVHIAHTEPVSADTPVKADQNAVSMQDTPTPKKTKKLGTAVLKYQAIKPFAPEQTITIVHEGPNPKRRKSAQRYDLYENGMTVGAYIEKSHKAGNSKSLAANDVRWDFSKGWINVQ